MIYQVLLRKDENNLCEHFIPFTEIESYGRFSETGVGYDDTHIIMKHGGEYRIVLPVETFHKIYAEWNEKLMFNSMRN